MKDLITDALQKKLEAALSATGGVKALYGDPITVDGKTIVPVARVRLVLQANAEGEGGGRAGLKNPLSSGAKGGGGGVAGAGVEIIIEPAGFLTPDGDTMRFNAI